MSSPADDDIVTVLRTLEYTGKRSWVENALQRSLVEKDKPFKSAYGSITQIGQTLTKCVPAPSKDKP